MPVACGERFKRLLKNGLGHTGDNLCGVLCLDSDAQSWYDAAHRMRMFVLSSWRAYVDWVREKQLAAEPGLYDRVLKYSNSVTKLHEPTIWYTLVNTTWTALAGEYYSNMETGACLLEQIEDAFDRAGGNLPPIPGLPPAEKKTVGDAIGGALGTLAVVTIVGGVSYLAWKVSR